MVRIHIQLPLNISRLFESVLEEHVEANAAEYQEEVTLVNLHTCGEKEAADHSRANIMIGFIPEIEMQDDKYILKHFVSVPGRFPLKRRLQDRGFVDPRGCFQVFGIVSFVPFYNPVYTKAADLPRTWSDLLHRKWKGRIMMPGKEHIAPRLVRAVLKYENPERARAVDENIICGGVPPNVIEAVKSGHVSLGVTNITFGKISEGLQTKMIWPEDGLLCMPQIIVWEKNIDERMMKLGDFLLSPEVQRLLSQQAFFPAAPGAEYPEIFKTNRVELKWPGWDNFREALKKSES